MGTLRNFACMILGFAAAAGAFATWTPARPVLTVSEKLERYAEAADEYDALAIGSSLTYRQIIPSIFDRTASDAGQPMHLFNLGVDGMRPPEDTYVLEQALALRRTPLKVVLVECNRIRFHVRPQDENSLRSIYWHDGRRLATLARFALWSAASGSGVSEDSRRAITAIPTLWRHLDFWFRNVSALGRGHEALVASLLGIQPASSGIGLDGYAAPPARDGLTPAELRRYEQAVASLRAGSARYDLADPVSQAELDVKRRLVERSGARMILIVPPDPMTRHFMPTDEAQRAEVLDFSDPNEYPDLYDPADRRDTGHLEVAGAELYTRLVAGRIAARLKNHP